MATILLSAVGTAVGGALGGSVLGLSSAVIGRAVGATLGRVIDQRLMGQGSQAVETGRLERYRLTGASEGSAIANVYGRMRVGGQVVWATRFKEASTTTGGGKGTPSQPRTTSYSYSVSLAVAVCEGEILRVGRIWADGAELSKDDLTLRVYTGHEDQLPDPKIEAVEGTGTVPAYRGLAYVVFEDLPLADYGNRVPQFSFEVVRPADPDLVPDKTKSLSEIVEAVALVPGSGEYALATTPVHFSDGLGGNRSANVNSPSGKTDFATSLEQLNEELPNCGAASLVVSWFGNDLRVDQCTIRPKVEQPDEDGSGMAWVVSSETRGSADVVPEVDGRPIYGGTPADQSVVEAITALRDSGKSVMFYPFILMDQLEGNTLIDPWTGDPGQPHLPWRGRITTSLAPGLPFSPDGTVSAQAEVAAFFGAASASDFTVNGESVAYTGPAEWSYRRFILHYAHLCVAAGGVDAFCLGSEMRSLTQVRGASNSFPAVAQMVALAAELRTILGPLTKIGYAADWTEYFGYQPEDGTGDVFFHLDPLWADANIDFVGIDNYMPVSDWRDGLDHADAGYGAIHNIDYLHANVEGGEGYDWYYDSTEGRDAQVRLPITDGAHGEPWVYRYKDIRSWWSNVHHERIGGVRQSSPTAWVAESKPIWFTEIGCAAVDKGTNEPNKFLDPKSSESSLPRYSNGTRDDLIQAQYLRALTSYWGAPGRNPGSSIYAGPMLDMSRAHVWAWDTRPFPAFPNQADLWSDAENYSHGHWLNGRTTTEALAAVVSEICVRSGVKALDTDRLYGLVRGYAIDQVNDARAALQPLMLAYGFEAVERGGALQFRMRTGVADAAIGQDILVERSELDGDIEIVRAPEAETAGRVRLSFVEADGNFEARSTEAVFPDDDGLTVSHSEMPLALTATEARQVVERWLSEARVARDTARFALPPSVLNLGAGDVIALPEGDVETNYRIDHLDHGASQLVEAVRVEPHIYVASDEVEDQAVARPFVAPLPVKSVFLDLPLVTGEEVEHAPHLAVAADPWPGSVAVYSSSSDDGYTLNSLIEAASVIGVTETPLAAAGPGRWDRGTGLRVRIGGGALASVDETALFNGANALAIGDGSSGNWEILQFQSATLVAQDTYELSQRLRGQLGTDSLMPSEWPIGSTVVLLDGTPAQIQLAASARDLARHYRIGPAGRSLDDPSFEHLVEAFPGNGLRPYAPVHLRGVRDSGGDLQLSWIRRTRIDGDSWSSVEVPLGEASEQYQLRVTEGGVIRREVTLFTPSFTYFQWQQTADGITGPFAIEVAQLSERFGAGPFRRIDIDG